MCQLIIRQYVTSVSLIANIFQNLYTERVEILSELFALNPAAIGRGEHRGLEGFHERPRQETAFYRPKDSLPVGRRKITDGETLVRLNVACNVRLERHCFDLFASRLHLTEAKNRNKSNLETLPGGIYPSKGLLAEPQSMVREPQRGVRVQIAGFLSVGNSILGLMASARVQFSQTTAVPSAIRPIRTVAGSWKDHRWSWKWPVWIT